MSRTFDALQKAKEFQLTLEEQTAPNRAEAEKRDEPTTTRRVAKHANIAVMETFRLLKYNILNADQLGSHKTIVFSSSVRNEGSSTILVNFARTLAADGESVLVVDANFQNPVLHQLFGAGRKDGLAEALNGRVDVGQCVKASTTENISVMCAGAGVPAGSHQQQSKAMGFLIEQLRSRAEWMLFDSPPVTISDDALVLGSKVDGVVLVVLADKTRREVTKQAVQMLESARARILGVVLNKRQIPIPGWLYRRL